MLSTEYYGDFRWSFKLKNILFIYEIDRQPSHVWCHYNILGYKVNKKHTFFQFYEEGHLIRMSVCGRFYFKNYAMKLYEFDSNEQIISIKHEHA